MATELVNQWLQKANDADCAQLTPYSVQTRYPNCIEILESEAKSAVLLAKKIYEFVEQKIAGTKGDGDV